MTAKYGKMKVMSPMWGDEQNGLFTETTIDVIQKTEGNYNENLLKSISFNVQYENGNEISRDFLGQTAYAIHPNTTLENAINSVATGEQTWIKELTII